MQYKDYLYSKVAEEAAELAQSAIKCMLFGEQSTDPTVVGGDTNQQAFNKEFTDLIAVISLLNEQMDLTGDTQFFDIDEKRLDTKRIKVKAMHSTICHNRMKGIE